jgi:hypothetical protein
VKTAMAGHLSPGEVERWLRSGRAVKRHPGDIEATMLYDIASSQLELYQDTTNSLHALFEAEEGHYELYPLASIPIKAYLRKLAKKELNKVVRRDVINAVLDQLQAEQARPLVHHLEAEARRFLSALCLGDNVSTLLFHVPQFRFDLCWGGGYLCIVRRQRYT